MKSSKVNAIAITASAMAIILPSCKDSKGSQQQGAAPELAVLTVDESTTTTETAYPTTLQGENDVEIRPQTTGFLTKVCVEEGQKVSKGQTLFVIDQVQLQAAVDAAQAQVAVAQAQVNTAQTNANNNKILLDKNIISSAAYQTSVDALNQAKASLNAANANLVSARKSLSYSNVTAPISGLVGTLPFKEGTLVSPQTQLTIISNNSDMQADFSINEKDILAMTLNGQRSLTEAVKALPPVTLQLANGEKYAQQGKIVAISGVIDPSTGAASAKAIFPNPNGMLHSGNTGKVLIPTTYRDMLLIPQKASYEIQDMKFVYVVGDSNKIHSRNITVSAVNDGQNYIVTGGLKPGETIVIEGVGVVAKDNMVISPKKK
ncbi:MAG: efflux RND transporter periplasmic adaptor subunit [Muribaculaceae bacterium]|nr:efflux RND transporter periplasmic adaptor subunit [Muribaculaceae bacterium]